MIKTVWAEWEQIASDDNDDDVEDSDKLTEDQVCNFLSRTYAGFNASLLGSHPTYEI